MANLLEETRTKLKDNNKLETDVLWCGSEEYGWFSWAKFNKLANKDYDASFGSPKVCTDLLVVGKDWWLERHEYDGSEWWEYKARPKKPRKQAAPVVIVDNSFMWQSLAESNRPGGKYGEEDS